MTRWLIVRAAAFVLSVVVGLSGLFLMLHTLPGSDTAGLAPTVAANPEARAAARRAQGLDRPLVDQYLDHVRGLLRGDLGVSNSDGSPAADAVATAAPVSIQLGVMAATLGLLPGLAAGVVAARHVHRPGDGTIRLTALVAVSVPSYWLAVLLLVQVGNRWPGLLPQPGGFVEFSEDPGATVQSLMLPAVVLAVGTFGVVARTTRSALIEVLAGDDVLFARAMGMTERQVLTRVALRNAAPAAVTVVGLVVAGLLAGTVLVENVFQVPGLGQLLVSSFSRHDYPVAMAAATVTAVAYLGLNLVVDVALALVDPRHRVHAARANGGST